MDPATISALMTIPALWIASASGVLFFTDKKQIFGLLNDVSSAGLMFLLVLPIKELSSIYISDVSTLKLLGFIAVAGLIVAGAGQIFLVLRLITLKQSFITGGLGILPFLVWVFTMAIKFLNDPTLDASFGIFSAALLIGILLLMFAFMPQKKSQRFKILSLIFFISITSAWLMNLASLIS